ncbi:MAG: hypothetical protein KDE35_08735 [Geminicoccaceae bacterium]|nr:hypothetical protein [Geminicoccaceae bacterium]
MRKALTSMVLLPLLASCATHDPAVVESLSVPAAPVPAVPVATEVAAPAPAGPLPAAVSREPAIDLNRVAREAGRSIWGVLERAPRRKADATDDLVQGTAVAVESGVLATGCRAVGRTGRVGLVRQNKYYVGQVVATDAAADICVIAAPDAPLNLGLGYRDPATLRAGEPVLALITTGRKERLALEGVVLQAPGDGPGRATTDIALPEDTMSAVFVDGRGRLLGLGPLRTIDTAGTAIAALPPLLAASPPSALAALE